MASTLAQASDAVAVKPRPIIHRMVLENFKSYGGAHTVGPFHKRFSSIVGPNGSGKSNVIDAMLFVFGERAKKLRLRKVSELIHKSSGLPDLEQATVSVHFVDIVDTGDGDEDYEVIEGSEIVVSRTAYRNNSSKYCVNGKTSTFTEVTTMLREKGIDLDNNRFLILQGEVEQISLMKPKAQNPHDTGMLEYLEDIIGSNKYVEPIDEAEKVLEERNERRSEQANRVKAAEKERDGLESGKLEAEEYLRKEAEIKQRQSVLYQCKLHEAVQAIEQLTVKETQLIEKQDYEKQKLKDVVSEAEEVKTAYDRTTKEYEAVHAEMEKARADFTSFERKDIKYREDIKHTKQQLKKQQKAIEKEQAKVVAASEQLTSCEEALPELQAAIGDREAEKATADAKLDKILDSLKGEVERFRGAIEQKEQEVEPLRQTSNEAKAIYERSLTEKQLIEERVFKVQRQLESLKLNEGELRACQRKLEGNVKQNRGDESATRKSLKAAKAELQTVEADEAKQAELVRDARNKLEDSRQAMEADSSRGAMLSRLMEAAGPRGPLARAGLHGRLGDLGAIDERYDVAITTACGALNWLVVDTTEGGQACISYLRKHKLGVARFIILDKIQWVQEHMNKSVSPPEGIPRLYDLVRVADERFRAAFYFALRNTLVASDLDQAVRVAYQGNKCQWRVVSESGELIDTSGTMAGGGKQARRGGMKSSIATAAAISPEELRDAERQLQQASDQLTALRKRKAALQREIASMEDLLPKLEVAYTKMQAELTATEEQLEDMRGQVAVLEKEAGGPSKAELQQIEAIDATVTEQKAVYDAAAAEAKVIEDQIAALQENVRTAGGKRLEKAKAAAEAAAEAVDTAVKALAKARAGIKSSTKAHATAEKNLAKMQAELESTTAKQETLKAEFKQLEEDAMEVMQTHDQARKVAKAKEEEVGEMKKAFEALNKTVTTVREVLVDIQNALQDYQENLKTNRKKEQHWSAKLQQLTCEYELLMKELPVDEETSADTALPPQPASSESATDADADEAMTGETEDTPATTTAAQAPSSMPALRQYTAEELAEFDVDELASEVAMLETRRDELRSNVNMQAIQEYRAKDREFRGRVAELDSITEERDAARKSFDGLRKQRLDEFMAGFSVISLKLKEMYRMITLGGDAELELVDSLDPFSEGIVFSVRPPKKSWKNISNLSGGEKTLSSLALIFALHHYKPTPLYVMDEIDAALDFKNVSIVANYIKDRTKDAQFVIISLRNNMFELADRLVGIYKTHDVTKSVTINPKKLAATVQQKRRTTTSQEAAETATAGGGGLALADRTNMSTA